MGSAANKFEFDKKKYLDIIKESIKTNTLNDNDDELKTYRFLM